MKVGAILMLITDRKARKQTRALAQANASFSFCCCSCVRSLETISKCAAVLKAMIHFSLVHSNAKIFFQSFFMLITTQPCFLAMSYIA